MDDEPSTQPEEHIQSKVFKRLKNILSNDEITFLVDYVLPSTASNLKMKYRLSEKYGFQSSKFHKKCKDMKNTILICQADSGEKFGGINYLTWGPESVKERTDQNLIFSISKKSVHRLRMQEKGKYKGTRKRTKSIRFDEQCGPIMGLSDLIIGDMCHEKKSCSSDFDMYELEGDHEPELYLANSKKFRLDKFFIYQFE